MKKKSKGIDELTLVFFVAVVAMVVVINNRLNEPKMDAKDLTEMILDDHQLSFATNGIVDEQKLEKIKEMDYDELKKSLNAKNDFCVYLEDENGNILLAKGSSKLSSDGLECRE